MNGTQSCESVHGSCCVTGTKNLAQGRNAADQQRTSSSCAAAPVPPLVSDCHGCAFVWKSRGETGNTGNAEKSRKDGTACLSLRARGSLFSLLSPELPERRLRPFLTAVDDPRPSPPELAELPPPRRLFASRLPRFPRGWPTQRPLAPPELSPPPRALPPGPDPSSPPPPRPPLRQPQELPSLTRWHCSHAEEQSRVTRGAVYANPNLVCMGVSQGGSHLIDLVA